MTHSDSILSDLSPADLGLPAKFSSFRPIQTEIAEYILYGPEQDGGKRFAAIGAPTGSGKSLSNMLAGKVSGRKFVILTATKALQNQVLADFGACGLVDIRGKNNYDCAEVTVEGENGRSRPVSCEEGEEHGCGLAGTRRCPYTAQVEKAKLSNAVSTNYQYWLNARAQNRAALQAPMRPVELLLCDECHKSVDELARFLSVWLSAEDITHYGKVKGPDVPWLNAESGRVTEKWMALLLQASNVACAEMDSMLLDWVTVQEARRHKEFRKVEQLCRNLDLLVSHGGDGNWIWQQTKRGVAFDCVWPRNYAERYLFSGVEKVALTGATTRPKLLSLLHIRRQDADFKEWPRVFPAKQGMVYYVPTVRMSHRMSREDLEKMVARVDEMMEIWHGHKGIIHTASYQRAEDFQAKSKYGRYMLLNRRGEADEAAERFRRSVLSNGDMCALVSPSYTTGWDFPLLEGERNSWQAIVKVPYHDQSNPLVKARAADDPEYEVYDIVQTLVQACGRRNRSEKDWCTSVIFDDHVKRFLGAARQYAPAHFRVYQTERIPEPQCHD